MLFVLLSSSVFGQAFDLTPQQIDAWNNVKQMGISVSDSACSGEISFAFQQATNIYAGHALSTDFLQALQYIQGVAGDIPEAGNFRTQFQNLTQVFTNVYNQKVQEQKAAAYTTSVMQAQAQASQAAAYTSSMAAAQAAASSSAAAAAAAATYAAAIPTDVMGANPAASNAPHAYGVISAAESDSTIVTLLLAIASLL